MSGDDRRDRERARLLMMAALDGEISAAEQEELDGLLNVDPGLREEWSRMHRVKEVTDTMTLKSPPEEIWGDYWVSVYNRMERGIGWVLASIGVIVLLGYGAWEFTNALLADASVPLFIKLAIFAMLVGGLILLVSVVREKWFVRRRDPYKEVQR